MEAMRVEYKALIKNETWNLVPYLNEKNVIENKWIYMMEMKNSIDQDPLWIFQQLKKINTYLRRFQSHKVTQDV